MPVVPCPGCAKKLNVPESVAGKRVRCPGCQRVLTVPAAAVPSPPSPSVPTPAPRPAPVPNEMPTPMPPAPRFRKPPAPEPLPLPDDDESDAREPSARGAVAGLRCPKCDAAAVVALPPNQFSRRPGYACAECDTRMRRAGTRGNFVAAMGLGGFIVLLGVAMVVLSFDAPRGKGRMIGGGVLLATLGATVAGWAGRQYRLPEPVGAKAGPSRVGFWVAVILLALLLAGGAVFGLMYYVQEMM